MIHEYRTYTITPGELAIYLGLAEEKVVPIRGSRYGKLVGFWTSEFGTLNQVHHIWQYASIDERNALRKELAVNQDWCENFLAGAWPTMQIQDIRFMNIRTWIEPQFSDSAFYERRIYRCQAGRFEEAARAVESRSKSSKAHVYGVWTCESPQPNEIIEILAYENWDSRVQDASTSAEQVAWWKKHHGLFQHADAALLLPIGISPSK
jgi:hypothetical protein